MQELLEYGYLGLFVGCFLAATILPLSSEALLSVMIISEYDMFSCIVIATIANSMGGMTSYFLGYLGKIEWLEKYFRINRIRLEKVQRFARKKGAVFAFLCWLPFVGDLIAVALGTMRSNWMLVALYMLIGKCLRYVVWAYLTFYIQS